jgi:hypothetical protein
MRFDVKIERNDEGAQPTFRFQIVDSDGRPIRVPRTAYLNTATLSIEESRNLWCEIATARERPTPEMMDTAVKEICNAYVECRTWKSKLDIWREDGTFTVNV